MILKILDQDGHWSWTSGVLSAKHIGQFDTEGVDPTAYDCVRAVEDGFGIGDPHVLLVETEREPGKTLMSVWATRAFLCYEKDGATIDVLFMDNENAPS